VLTHDFMPALDTLARCVSAFHRQSAWEFLVEPGLQQFLPGPMRARVLRFEVVDGPPAGRFEVSSPWCSK